MYVLKICNPKSSLKSNDNLWQTENVGFCSLLILLIMERLHRQLYNWFFIENWIPCPVHPLNEKNLVATLEIVSEAELKFGEKGEFVRRGNNCHLTYETRRVCFQICVGTLLIKQHLVVSW